MRAVSEGTPQHLAALPACPGFPGTGLCRWRGGFPLAELAVEFLKDALSVAFASSFAVERAIEHRLKTDRQEDAQYLHLKRAADRVELPVRSPRRDLVPAIEADQVVDLLCCREMPPAGRRSAARGIYGKATMLPSSRRMPCLRNRLSGEPAIGSACVYDGRATGRTG